MVCCQVWRPEREVFHWFKTVFVEEVLRKPNKPNKLRVGKRDPFAQSKEIPEGLWFSRNVESTVKSLVSAFDHKASNISNIDQLEGIVACARSNQSAPALNADGVEPQVVGPRDGIPVALNNTRPHQGAPATRNCTYPTLTFSFANSVFSPSCRNRLKWAGRPVLSLFWLGGGEIGLSS
jgi:hypothetical protein